MKKTQMAYFFFFFGTYPICALYNSVKNTPDKPTAADFDHQYFQDEGPKLKIPMKLSILNNGESRIYFPRTAKENCGTIILTKFDLSRRAKSPGALRPWPTMQCHIQKTRTGLAWFKSCCLTLFHPDLFVQRSINTKNY